jgi:hypothetical protein
MIEWPSSLEKPRCTTGPSRVPLLDVLPFLVRPLLGESTEIEPPANDKLTLAEDLRLPTIRLAVKAQLGAPRQGLVPETPHRLAWRRLPGWCWRSGRAVEGVVGHPDTIPRGVTG